MFGNVFANNSDSLLVSPATVDQQENNKSSRVIRKKAKDKTLSADAREMISIRTALGMTQPDFAIALETMRDRVINIENGRLKNVPKDLVDRARSLLESEKDNRVRILETLKSMSMDEILDRWWKMMGATNDMEGAILMGMATITVDRWRKGETHPPGADLLRYELTAKRMSV